MLHDRLTKLDLNDKERAVYSAIVQAGKASTARISRMTGINRTTVHGVCGELAKKCLVRESVGEKVAYWMPREGNDLDRIVAREREALAQTEDTVSALKEALKAMPGSKTFSIPKLRHIDEEELGSYLHEASPRWNESILAAGGGTTWWGFQDHTFVEHYEKWIVWYWKHAPQDIDLKLFTNDSTIEKHMVRQNIARRQIRFWEGDSAFTGTLWVTGDYITMIQTAEHPFYLVEIRDAVLAHNMREIFRKLWK